MSKLIWQNFVVGSKLTLGWNIRTDSRGNIPPSPSPPLHLKKRIRNSKIIYIIEISQFMNMIRVKLIVIT